MGWLFTEGLSRKELIKERTQDWAGTTGEAICLAHCTRGNVLWKVWELRPSDPNKPVMRYIACDLIASHGDGYGWGYKDMEESMHPYYYTCPLSYLEMVPAEYPNSWNNGWREGVRQYHAKMKARRETARSLAVGDQVEIVGSQIEYAYITRKKPLQGIGSDGRLYSLPRKFLGRILSKAVEVD